jgi:hypothetical protein
MSAITIQQELGDATSIWFAQFAQSSPIPSLVVAQAVRYGRSGYPYPVPRAHEFIEGEQGYLIEERLGFRRARRLRPLLPRHH